jgi:uncharacterized protein YgiM (DUF1202 family)
MKLSRLSGLLQFIIGFFLGMALLLGGAATAAYFLLSNMTSAPPKPIFAEEKKELAAKQEAPQKKSAPKEVQKPTPSPSPEAPSNSYKARVSWSEGLSLRAEPSTESARLGTVPYKAEILVLGTNPENTWQKIRLLSSGEEGWIKGGNVEKIE